MFFNYLPYDIMITIKLNSNLVSRLNFSTSYPHFLHTYSKSYFSKMQEIICKKIEIFEQNEEALNSIYKTL